MIYTATHTALPGEHTPNTALDKAFTWLVRTPTGFVDAVLLTLPGRLYREQETTLFDELQRVLGEARPLFTWGQTEGLAREGWEVERITCDLSLCYHGWDRPTLRADLILPHVATASREFPPQLVEWCLRSTCGERCVIIDVFSRAQHIAVAVAQDLGARVLTVGPVIDQFPEHPSVPCPFWAQSKDFADVFQSRLLRAGECLIYNGKPNSDGYARLKILGVEHYAHRVAWQIKHKRGLPENVPVLHSSCPDKRCCLPAHLRAGTTDNNLGERWLGRRRS